MATLKVEVPAERVSKAWNAIASDYIRHARIPGYRPGKAPRSVIENKFKKEIKEEVTKRLLSESFREAVSEKKLNVLSLTEIEDVELSADQPMRFTATLITAPEFDMPSYIGIPVAQKPVEVTDEEVETWLDGVRNQAADFTEVKGRALQMDDFAIIDYTGTIDGKPVEELYPKAGKPLTHRTGFWIRMTPEAFFPGFSDALIGSQVAEKREFDIQVPADFALAEMANQKIHYEVTVTAIKQKVLPELNDQWAASILPGKTVAELRDAGRGEIRQQKESENIREKRDKIMTHLLSKVECELPPSLVREETKRVLAEIVRENQARGIADEIIRENEKDLVDSAVHSARDRIKGRFILMRIASQEKISVTPEELQHRIRFLAQRYQMTPDKLRKELEKRESLDEVRDEILTSKVLDFLSSNVTVPANLETAS